jgi:hypothetical protein
LTRHLSRYTRQPVAYFAQAAARGSVGLVCPDCVRRHFCVVYTRQKDGHIERRRQCRHCGRRITTWEREIGT